MLQWNAPAPARIVSDRTRERRRRARERGLHRRGAVAGQPVRPVFVTRVQCLLDEQATKAGAVDEQIAFDDGSRMQHQRLDVARFRILADLLDLAFDALDTASFGETSQEFCVLPGIEVVGVIDVDVGAGRKLVLLRGLQLEAIIAKLRLDAELEAPQPEIVELAHPGRLAVASERVDIAISDASPVLEQDSELERGGRRAHELLFVDLQQLVKDADRWNRGFTDTDGADFIRLDQCDLEQLAELM